MIEDPHHKPQKLRQTLQSVLAAALGVQSENNRVRDFNHGRPAHFILLGLGLTALFVLLILGLVELILHLARP